MYFLCDCAVFLMFIISNWYSWTSYLEFW